MRWLNAVVIATVLSLLFGARASADPLTRREAVRKALAQNPQVAAARAKESAAKARAEQVDAARHPDLSLLLATGPALTARLVPGTAVQSTEDAYEDVGWDDVSVVVGSELNVVQPIYTFGKIGLRDEASAHDLRARQAQTRMTKAQLVLEVAEIYEGLLFAHDAELFFEEVDHMLEGAIAATRDQLEDQQADTNERELLQLESARSFAKLQLHRARASLQQAKAGLRDYLGLGVDAEVEVPAGGLAPIESGQRELSTLQERAQQQRPELTALHEGAAALNALAEAEDAGALPDIFALGFVSAAYTPGRDLVDTRYVVDPQQHFVPGVLLGLRWQWQAGAAAARADERRAEATELSQTRAWAKQGITAEVRAAYEDAERAHLDIQEAEKAVEVAKRWVVMATADHTVGMADSRAVVEAVEAYAGLRVSLMEARYRYNLALAKLGAATGTLDRIDGPFYPGAPAQSDRARQTAAAERSQP